MPPFCEECGWHHIGECKEYLIRLFGRYEFEIGHAINHKALASYWKDKYQKLLKATGADKPVFKHESRQQG